MRRLPQRSGLSPEEHLYQARMKICVEVDLMFSSLRSGYFVAHTERDRLDNNNRPPSVASVDRRHRHRQRHRRRAKSHSKL